MKKITYLFTPIFLVLLLFISSITPAISLSEDISTKVFRLHILANSDTDEDQALKLKVRDKVLTQTENLYKSCKNVDDAIRITNENINQIKEAAQTVILDCGYEYNVKVYTAKEYFNTRKYDSFSLPAGMYDSLKIEIGKAEGHNWWCVMFPTVCISGCTGDLEESLTPEEIELIENDKYVIRFKAVEIYEKIKSKF